MLEKEREYYERNRSEWLGRYPGRFVLVRGETLEGVYDTHEQAMSEGARRFGLGPYLIRRVEATEPEIRVPALTLGLIHANPDGAVGESGTGA